MKKTKRTIFWIIVISLCIISGYSSKKEMIFYDFPLEKQDIDKVLLTNELKWTAEEELKILNSAIELFASTMDGERLYKSAAEYYKEKGDQVDVAYEVQKDGDYYTLIFLKEKWNDTYFLKSINISNKSTNTKSHG